jgi:hypothetical protein
MNYLSQCLAAKAPAPGMRGAGADTMASLPTGRPGADQSLALQAQPIPKSRARRRASAVRSSALASYGRQMKDQDMIHMAQRILDRAIRRGGELLGEMKANHGGDRKVEIKMH